MKGIGASDGIALGKAKRITTESSVNTYTVEDTEQEVRRATHALDAAGREISNLVENGNVNESTLGILHAHQEILADPTLIEQIKESIETNMCNAEGAVSEVLSSYEEMFQGMDDEYLRERAADMRDIKRRILRLLGSGSVEARDVEGESAAAEVSVILVADDIGPSELATYEFGKLVGLITGSGGTSSHSAIIARSMGIPAVVGVGSDIQHIPDGATVALDGSTGKIVVNPDEAQIAEMQRLSTEHASRQTRLAQFKHVEAITQEGDHVHIAANVVNSADVGHALEVGVQGVGLFRTEFLFMDRPDFPSEEEQFVAYRDILEQMQGKPVVIRTLDIGGDKPLDYLPIVESNPFLGYRAIRICLDRPEVFETQLRALYRASEYGELHIMFPMIATVEELKMAIEIADRVRGTIGVAAVPIGIMVETPAAVWMSDALAPMVDFFSIGSNDLVQYTMACDRTNERVSYLNHFYQPAVLRSVQHVIEAAHRFGKPVAMCGEMAGDEALIPVLYAMGLDEFSMSPSRVLAAKEVVCNTNRSAALELRNKVLQASSGEEVKRILGVK